jgi:hypothetical protein
MGLRRQRKSIVQLVRDMCVQYLTAVGRIMSNILANWDWDWGRRHD